MSTTPVLRPRRSMSGTPTASGGTSITDTPVRNSLLHNLKNNSRNITPALSRSVADASFHNEDKVSPVLAMLRMTPGRLLKEKQSILVRKHEESKRKLNDINVGGGVSMWPEMVSMRMTSQDVGWLAATCLTLCVILTIAFYILHGPAISELLRFHRILTKFPKQHGIEIHGGQEDLDSSVVQWHIHFREIVKSIHRSFDVTTLPYSNLLYMMVYTATVGILFYYLVDNMLAKSKLSPNRIRRWVCLLTVSGTWTLLMLVTLAIALRTEAAVEMNIHALADMMADVIGTSLSCDKLSSVLQYWRIQCLPPTTHGTVAVFGLVAVRDLIYYLQYYSLPLGTVLLTPVFKLIVSLMTVYNIGSQKT